MNQKRTIPIKIVETSIPANEQCKYCGNLATGYARKLHEDIPHCDEHERDPWIIRVETVEVAEAEDTKQNGIPFHTLEEEVDPNERLIERIARRRLGVRSPKTR